MSVRWTKDAPDHWSAESGEMTLGVWPRAGGMWTWDVWNLALEPDEPIAEGNANTISEAKATAVRTATALQSGTAQEDK